MSHGMDYSENLQMTSLVSLNSTSIPITQVSNPLTTKSPENTTLFTCPVPICQHATYDKDHFEQHMRTNHPLDKPKFYCDICAKGFTSAANRNRHKTNLHTRNNVLNTTKSPRNSPNIFKQTSPIGSNRSPNSTTVRSKIWSGSEVGSFLEIFRIIFSQKIEIFRIVLPVRPSGSFYCKTKIFERTV